MLLPLISIASSPAGASVEYVPAGWVSSEPGYWMTEPDGRDLLAALQTYRQEAELWEQTARGMETSIDVFRAEITEQLKVLEDQINSERKEHRAAQRKSWLYIALAGGIGYAVGR